MKLTLFDALKYTAVLSGIAASTVALYINLWPEGEAIIPAGAAIEIKGRALRMELYHENLRTDCNGTARSVTLISPNGGKHFVVFSLDIKLPQGPLGLVSTRFDADVERHVPEGSYTARVVEVYRCSSGIYQIYTYPNKQVYVGK